MSCKGNTSSKTQETLWGADYEWDTVTQLSRQQTPKVAIDAFLDIFCEVSQRGAHS